MPGYAMIWGKAFTALRWIFSGAGGSAKLEMGFHEEVRYFWVSTHKATGLVAIDKNKKIFKVAPIWKKFRNLPFDALLDSLKQKTPNVQIEEIK